MFSPLKYNNQHIGLNFKYQISCVIWKLKTINFGKLIFFFFFAFIDKLFLFFWLKENSQNEHKNKEKVNSDRKRNRISKGNEEATLCAPIRETPYATNQQQPSIDFMKN